MTTDRSHAVKAAEISDQAKGAPAFTFKFEVFRTCTFVIITDAAGAQAGHFDIARADWDALVEHTSRVRRDDRDEAEAEDPRIWGQSAG